MQTGQPARAQGVRGAGACSGMRNTRLAVITILAAAYGAAFAWLYPTAGSWISPLSVLVTLAAARLLGRAGGLVTALGLIGLQSAVLWLVGERGWLAIALWNNLPVHLASIGVGLALAAQPSWSSSAAARTHNAAELIRAQTLVESLSQVATQIQAAAGVEDSLRRLGAGLEQLGITCVVAVLDPDRQALTIEYASIDSAALAGGEDWLGRPLRGLRVPQQVWPYRQALDEGQGHFVSSAASLAADALEPIWGPPPEAVLRLARLVPGIAAIVLPLALEARTLGVLVIWGPDLREQDVPTFSFLANQVAIALHNARLLAAEQSARNQAEMLVTASLTLTQSLDLDRVLAALLDVLHRLIPFDTANTMLLEPDQRLAVRVMRGHEDWTDADLLRQRRFELDEFPTFEAIVATQNSLLVPDTHAYAEWVRLPATEYIRSWLGVPVVVEGRVIGVCSLSKSTPDFFTAEHVRLAEAVTAQASAAVHNARLFEQVRSGRERLQALSHRLVDLQENERRSIARELHDEVGQLLTGLKLTLELVSHLPARQAGERLAQAVSLVTDVMDRVHDLSLTLRPMMLDDQGLRPALLWLFTRYMFQTGVEVHFEYAGAEQRPPTQVETSAYRIIQEALTNVARHARAQEVWVRLAWEEGEHLRLQIQDLGVGLPAEPAGSLRAGISGMRERAALLGGWLEVESAPDAGTLITAVLPFGDRLERRHDARHHSAGG